MIKSLPAMRETRVQSLGWENTLEKEMATHSSILAWKSHGWRSVVGYSPWGCTESDMTERLQFQFGTVMAPLDVSFSLLIKDQGLINVSLSAILDPFDSYRFMLCPWAMSFFQKLCPVSFPPVILSPLWPELITYQGTKVNHTHLRNWESNEPLLQVSLQVFLKKLISSNGKVNASPHESGWS